MSRDQRPAVLGGKPAFASPLPITKPTIPPTGPLKRRIDAVLKSGMLTNAGTVKEFELAMAEHLGVRQVVALNSCTTGLMLCMKAWGLKGEIIIPSFTFHASAHAAAWNGLKIVFVDCDPETFTVDPKKVEEAITPQTCAILAVHTFGHPCDSERLEAIARKHNLKLLFDAAHGAGARNNGRPVGGAGHAESFSLSPTKLLTAGEGGIVSTNDEALAKQLRILRNYGDSGDYDCKINGFNARMNEFCASLGLESLKTLEKNVKRRNALAKLYLKLLSPIPGITFQKILPQHRSSYKDFAILIDQAKFGLSRDQLVAALTAENVTVKKYFDPPVHRQQVFKGLASYLPETDRIASTTLSVPLFSHMTDAQARGVCSAIKKIHAHAAEIRAARS
jgi:dTDP-4-amino-4,6-dideoxygalactose transaminase